MDLAKAVLATWAGSDSLAPSMLRRILWRSLFAVAGLAGLSVLGFGWVASSAIICPPRRVLQDYHREILNNPGAHGLRIRAFSTPQFGGASAPCLVCEPSAPPSEAKKGRILRDQLSAMGIDPAPWGEIRGTIVLLHGHKGRKEDFLPMAERFCAAGFRCLLVDLPAHGDNPLPYATFGKDEGKLPLAVLETASVIFGFDPKPAVLFGVSQGGAIAWQSMGNGDWKALATISAFADLGDVIDAQARRLFGPAHAPAFWAARMWCRIRVGFDPVEARPESVAERVATVPVLVGHGGEDQFVPVEHANRLLSHCPSRQKQFFAIEGGTHSNVFVTPAPVYATLAAFYLQAIEPAAAGH